MGRRLGQHFLRDTAILDRIVDALDPDPEETVIEIGPGEGTLTRQLLGRVGHVVAIERDAELARELTGAGNTHGLTVVVGDALEVHWDQSVPAPGSRRPAKVVGNIPYYITTPLIDKALAPPARPVVVFLVQKEVADRVAAAPGGKEYGALSVGVQTVARVERLFTVRAGAFSPPPKVDSAVIRLTPRPAPLLSPGDQPAFRRFVIALFSQRRKQLGRSLRDVAGLERDQALAVLDQAGIPPTDRPEVLAPEAVVALYLVAMR